MKYKVTTKQKNKKNIKEKVEHADTINNRERKHDNRSKVRKVYHKSV